MSKGPDTADGASGRQSGSLPESDEAGREAGFGS